MVNSVQRNTTRVSCCEWWKGKLSSFRSGLLGSPEPSWVRPVVSEKFSLVFMGIPSGLGVLREKFGVILERFLGRVLNRVLQPKRSRGDTPLL